MKYEYITYSPELKGFVNKKPDPIAVLEKLNEYGSAGWELIAITALSGNTGASYGAATSGLLYTFKRPYEHA